jgi:hypothetical protein
VKQTIFATAIRQTAAGVARPRPAHGICAYPWHLGGERADNPVAGMNVDLTESKTHNRWPGGPSS